LASGVSARVSFTKSGDCHIVGMKETELELLNQRDSMALFEQKEAHSGKPLFFNHLTAVQ
jgi:hypothetical protein